MVEPDAPILAEVQGLISKSLARRHRKKQFWRFLLMGNKKGMEDFMNSDLVKAVVSRQFIKNVSSVDYEVNHNTSLHTRELK